MNTRRRRILCLIICCLWAKVLQGGILFEDVGETAGFTHVGNSFGAAWGDYDSDGYPDLWVTNHREPYSLYLNNRDGTFTDIAGTVVLANPLADTHGAAWGDFDNDGDQDLFQAVGAQAGAGSSPNLLLVNEDGTLVDEAATRGVTYPFGRGRTPLWFDRDSDGDLDVLVANIKRPDGQAPTVFFEQQDEGIFQNATLTAGILAPSFAFHAQITGVTDIDEPLLLIHAPKYPQRAYRYGAMGPVADISSQVGLYPEVLHTVQDSVIADLDGNLEPDLLLVSRVDVSDYQSIDTTTLRAHLVVTGEQHGVEVETLGDLTVSVSPDFDIEPEEIFLGAGGIHPGGLGFTLAVSDLANDGIAAHSPGVDRGLYIGRDTTSGRWQLFLSSDDRLSLDILLEAGAEITGDEALGFIPFNGKQPRGLLSRVAGIYSDQTDATGLAGFFPCDSVIAEDFDNDMDVDIYMSCRSMVGNEPNILMENNGSGAFVAVPLAGGAEGADTGRGDTVVSADYDLDGYMDLFLTNGSGFGAFSEDGPDQLFRNTGSGNHWLEIDLEGVISNRDGIGARVISQAGGKQQMRDHDGGMHRYAQDFNRIHFGMKDNPVGDYLVVQWPSGIRQTVFAPPNDQLLRIVEPSYPDMTGQPPYTPGVDRGVYLWRESPGGAFHLRVSGGAVSSSFTIRVVTLAPFQSATAVGLEPGDALLVQDAGFELNTAVLAEEDGVDFQVFPGAPVLISIERDGIRNPRELRVGASGLPVSPGGWVLGLEEMPERPAYVVDQDLGLFLGVEPAGSQTLAAHWSSDSMTHSTTLVLMSGEALSGIAGIDHEPEDTLFPTSYGLFYQGSIGPGIDGVTATTVPGSLIGIATFQDGLFQSHRLNPLTREFGQANAYLLF